MPKETETEYNFKIDIKEMNNLIENQKVTVKDANKIVSRCVNVLIHYQQMKSSRDNWRSKYEELKNGIK